jgi:hypothetical protein
MIAGRRSIIALGIVRARNLDRQDRTTALEEIREISEWWIAESWKDLTDSQSNYRNGVPTDLSYKGTEP